MATPLPLLYLRQRGYALPGVCLFVCLSVCLLETSRKTTAKFHERCICRQERTD